MKLEDRPEIQAPMTPTPWNAIGDTSLLLLAISQSPLNQFQSSIHHSKEDLFPYQMMYRLSKSVHPIADVSQLLLLISCVGSRC